MRKLLVTSFAVGAILVAGWALAEVREAPGEPADEAEPADEVEPADSEEAAEAEPAAPDEVQVDRMPTDTGGFVEAIREQITRAGRSPSCDEARGRCSYLYEGEGGRRQEVQVWYSGESRTIYIFAPWVATSGVDSPATPVVARHLAAIGRMLNIARFEWNPASGEVRLSTVMNVDSNLDRRALVGLTRLVEQGVDRYAPALDRIARDHEHAPPPPRPAAPPAETTVRDQHGYVAAIEQELEALGLRTTCDAAHGRCTYELDSTSARNVFPVVVQYNPESATVLITTDRYLSAPMDNPRTDRLLQRLLELNWEQLVPMFQWDAGTGHVRLTAAMNTDTNFDRRAFRGVVQALHAVAERNYRALRTVLNP